jgi:hypothetical protein
MIQLCTLNYKEVKFKCYSAPSERVHAALDLKYTECFHSSLNSKHLHSILLLHTHLKTCHRSTAKSSKKPEIYCKECKKHVIPSTMPGLGRKSTRDT